MTEHFDLVFNCCLPKIYKVFCVWLYIYLFVYIFNKNKVTCTSCWFLWKAFTSIHPIRWSIIDHKYPLPLVWWETGLLRLRLSWYPAPATDRLWTELIRQALMAVQYCSGILINIFIIDMFSRSKCSFNNWVSIFLHTPSYKTSSHYVRPNGLRMRWPPESLEQVQSSGRPSPSMKFVLHPWSLCSVWARQDECSEN